jgi:non-specific serine/threonine protein kinase
VTTRTLLRVSGEFDYRVPPLDVPAPDTELPLDALADYPAVRLFVVRARAADPAFELTEANAPDIAGICRAVDGLPLAIELAAAQTRLFSTSTLLRHLDRRLAVLIEGPHDQPARLQTMRNAIAWSYDLLTPEQQSLLRCMSVFTGGFTEDALAAVCFDQPPEATSLLQQLGRLFDHSLLLKSSPGSGEQRYVMLETIREFCLEHLTASGEEDRVRSAHSTYYLDLAASAEPRLIVVGSAAWVERLTVERANIRQAATWALAHDRTEPVLRLAGTLLSMAYARGEPGEGLSWLESALARPPTAPPEVIADALFTASALAQVQGDFDRAEELATKSRMLARDTGYQFGEGRALIGLGITAEWREALDAAAGHYREALALMQEVGPAGRLAHWTVLPLANLADIALLQRDLPAAIDLGHRAVAAWREAGYLWGIAQALGTVAAAYCERGDLAASRTAYAEVLDLWVACADGRGIAGAIAGIAGLSLATGRTEQAARLLGAAENVRRELGVQFVAHHLYAQHVLATARSRLDAHAFDQQWTAGQQLGVEDAIAECRTVLATLAGAQPRPSPNGLSARELEVLQLITAGHPDREIALALSISPRTVQSHVTAILTKLNAHSRSEAAAIAVRRGLV